MSDVNVMRHTYRPVSQEEHDSIQKIKDAGLAFYELCDAIGQSREMSLAKTKVEEAVMWATKHISR